MTETNAWFRIAGILQGMLFYFSYPDPHLGRILFWNALFFVPARCRKAFRSFSGKDAVMMIICHEIGELKDFVRRCKKEGKSIGLVTTMGALHEGHASLIRAARKETTSSSRPSSSIRPSSARMKTMTPTPGRLKRTVRLLKHAEPTFFLHRLLLPCIRTKR